MNYLKNAKEGEYNSSRIWTILGQLEKKNQKKFYSKKISELFHCLRINPSNKFNGPRIFKKSKN